MSRTRYNILPVSLLLVIALAIVATPALAAGTVTRSMPATAAPGATVTVTLTPSSDFTPGFWGATETLPAGWTFVSTTADGNNTANGVVYRFTELSAIPITYTVTAPAAWGAYTFGGTFVDSNRNTGTVGGATSVTVGIAPAITKITPASTPTPWYWNATIPFTITGKYFEPGQTTVAFVNKSTLAPLNATMTWNTINSTTITGTVVVPFGAPASVWNASVTTVDGGTGWLGSAFTVNKFPAPTINLNTASQPGITPSTWYQNSTVQFTINGNNFEPGQTQVYLLNQSTGLSLNITSPSPVLTSITSGQIVGTYVIPYNALTSSAEVIVSTADGGTSSPLTKAFTVSKFPAPTINPMTATKPGITYPAGALNGNIDTTILFTITGTNFQSADKTSVTISNSITNTVLPVTIISIAPTTIIGSVTVPGSTPAGSYDVSVSTFDGGTAVLPGSFTVGYVAYPTLSTSKTLLPLVPVSGYQNTTVNFAVNGTNFEPGQTTVAFTNATTGASLNQTLINYYNATSTTLITGNVSIPYNAPTGSYRLDITTADGGVVNLPNAFTVKAPLAPTITTVKPTSTWYQNATIPFVITGTNFRPGQTSVGFNYPSNGAVLNSTIALNTVNGTTITGTVVVPFNAATGTWNASVTTVDGGTVWNTTAFTVKTFPAPIISSITPNTGTKNSVVAFTLYGNNFEPAGTSLRIVDDTSGTVFTPSIITILTNTNPQRIVGTFAINATVPAGYYRLEVTTVDGGVNSTLGAFTVTYLPTPAFANVPKTSSPLNPNIGYLNATVPFTLTGNYFQNGGTVVMLRNASTSTTINATPYLTSVNTTTITGSFPPLPYNGATGPYTLYVVTNGGGFNSSSNAFTVKVPTPVITGISASTLWYQNTTVAFTLSGSNFQSDATSVRFLNPSVGTLGATTEMDPTIYSVNSSQIVGSVSIPNTASKNSWNINVTTLNGGTTIKTGAFTVSSIPSPTIGTFAPTGGARGTSVFFTLPGTNFEANGGTTVTISNSSTVIGGSTVNLPVMLNTVFPSFITGTVNIPATGAPTGRYYVNVTTADGGKVPTLGSFTVV